MMRLSAAAAAAQTSTSSQIANALGTGVRVPSGMYLSPRAGFSWGYGHAKQVAGFAGAAQLPRATVRGGVGLYQNVPGASLIGKNPDCDLPS